MDDEQIWLWEHPLMMSDFRGGGGSKMAPKIGRLEGKNWTLGGYGVKKDPKNRTSLMDAPFASFAHLELKMQYRSAAFLCKTFF